jgi:DNA polymerase-1
MSGADHQAPHQDLPATPSAVQVGVSYDGPPVEVILTSERLQAVLPTLAAEPVIALDTETTGLDPRSDRLRLVQLATPAQTLVIDIDTVPAPLLTPLFAQASTTFVGHNVKFDLQFLRAAGVAWPAQVDDTEVLARLLSASGAPMPKGYHTLGTVAERTVGVTLEKSFQTSDWSGALSAEQLRYAATDAAVLLPVYEMLRQQCVGAGLERVRAIEASCLLAIAWMEQCGIALDTAAWLRRAEEDSRQLGIAEAHLCAELHRLLDTCGGDIVPESVNWNSAKKQVLPLLQAYCDAGITSTNEETLQRLAPDHRLAALLLDHRAVRSAVERYGAKLAALVHPVTHRLHGQFNQLGSRAGRMSGTKPNLQQVPRSTLYRTSFVAEPGYALVKADYSQIELRIAAVLANEARMLWAFNQDADLHTQTAAALFRVPVSEVTPDQRALAKTTNFGLLYGMGAAKLRQKIFTETKQAISQAEAAQHKRAFLTQYPAIDGWQRATGAELRRLQAVDTRTMAGRRRLAVSRYTEALNTPVQGTGADGMKLALARLYAHRHDVPDARLLLCIHDEVVVECPQAEAEATAHWLSAHMEQAMSEVVGGKVPMKVDVTIGKDWAGTPLPQDDVETLERRPYDV